MAWAVVHGFSCHGVAGFKHGAAAVQSQEHARRRGIAQVAEDRQIVLSNNNGAVHQSHVPRVEVPDCPVDTIPNFRRMSNPGCLTAAHEAQLRAANQPRVQVEQVVQMVLQPTPRVDEPPKAIDDRHWAAQKRKQRGYLHYLQQLQAKLVDGFASGSEFETQLVYQVGLTEHWLQLQHLTRVFPAHLTPALLAALCRRLPDCAPPKVRAAFSTSEARDFGQFLQDLFSSCRSASASMRVDQAATVLYAAAVLQQEDPQLCSALVDAVEPQLGAAGPADWSRLAWSLGKLGHRPGDAWLQCLCDCSKAALEQFQPNQLWGILLGLALLGFGPQQPWMKAHLLSSRAQLKDFSAEGLGNLVQGLSLLGYPPKRQWLRDFVGMCNHKIRSFLAVQCTQLVEGLCRLGYLPRPEVQLAIMNQIRRHFHTFMPSQLATILHSMALQPWSPHRQFLYDFVAHSAKKMVGFSVAQACRVVWAFARFDVLPEDEYAVALLLQVQRGMAAAQPESLAHCMWALGRFRRRPNQAWLAAWFQQAEAQLDAFRPADVAPCVWAFAALQLQPQEGLLLALLEQVRLQLAEASNADLAQLLRALADMRFQPADEWMEEVAAEVAARLPTLEGNQYGDVAWGLALLGCPLDPDFLAQLEREAYRKLAAMDGNGLAHLLWGLAQFGHQPQSTKWWPQWYRFMQDRVEDLSARSTALALVALGELVHTAPPIPLQLALMKSIRERFPKPPSSADIAPTLQQAALLPAGGSHLPSPLWLQRFLLELQRRWGLAYAPAAAAAAVPPPGPPAAPVG